MKTARLCISVIAALTLTAALLTGCGGGGGGGGAAAPPLPAAFNVQGNWTVTETASATTVCDTVIVTAGRTDPNFTLAVTQTGLQSNLTVLDARSSPPPLAATMSDKTVTYSGSRYDPWSTGCGLIESAVVTMSTASHFSGTGTITCPGICSVPTTLVGNRP